MPYACSSGLDIYYELWGSAGPALVLIRGFASPLSTWNGVADDLARDHRVVVFDNRGSGRSASPPGAYSAASMAEDVAAVLEAAGFDFAHVLGTSLGGMIAQELALRYPAQVQSLVLAATTSGHARCMPLRPRGVCALALAALLPIPRLQVRMAALATLSAKARCSAIQSVDRYADNCRAPHAGLFGQACAILRHHTTARLAQISAPTLIIHGDADNLIHVRNAEALARLIPNAHIERWSEVGHDVATEAPERLAQRVRQHVGDCSGKGRQKNMAYRGLTDA